MKEKTDPRLERIQEPGERLGAFLRYRFHASPRGVLEFFLLAAALAWAEPSASSLVVGVLFAACGLLLRVWASGYGSHVRLRSGPFRWVRHPYLLGSAWLFLGAAFASAQSWVMAATLVLLPLAYWPSYQRGEARLRQILGPWFASYEAAVPAILPRLMPASLKLPPPALTAPQFGPKIVGFSMEYALLRGHRRELDAVLAVVAIGAAMYALRLPGPKPWQQNSVACAVVLLSAARFVYYATARRPGRVPRRSKTP